MKFKVTKTLKEILLQSKFVKEKDLDAALKTAQELNKPLEDILVFRGLISEKALGQLIAEHLKVPFVELKGKLIPLEILSLIPENVARTYHLLPFEKKKDSLLVAMEDPHDLEALELAKRQSGLKVIPYFANPQDLSRGLAQYKKNIKLEFSKIISESVKKTGKVEEKELAKAARELPVIKILDTILTYAVAERASDIHIEALSADTVVRFRIDGVLGDVITLPRQVHPAIVARVKILAKLKIDEHRIPQDGRFKFKVGDDYISLRVSIIPSFYGENIALRLLFESARPLSLEELGLADKNLELVRENIKKPHGMILVTGPTGCGKTTTLYSILNILNTIEVKICTTEDPIEYGIHRVNQIQINPKAGLTFASSLRSLVRHDPDIIMVGEIRDQETAEIAIHAALTGHLVLSTLHTNDAPGAIPRLLDMGAEGFLVASTVNLVIAQRLVRKVCPACLEEFKPDQTALEFFKKRFGEKILKQKFYRGKGCFECNQTGYKGRIGIFEVLKVDEKIRELTLQKSPAEAICKTALQAGMINMVEDGLDKAVSGITTIEEVLRVVRE